MILVKESKNGEGHNMIKTTGNNIKALVSKFVLDGIHEPSIKIDDMDLAISEIREMWCYFVI